MLANRTANLAVTYPVLCWLYCTTVPIPDFSDNYLGDNYLNCIYNYRYRNLSKLLFLHPSCNGSPPFSCSISKGGESPAPLTIQQSASHNKSILHSVVCKTDCSDPSGIHRTLFIRVHAPMRQSTMLESFLQYYLSIVSCEL